MGSLLANNGLLRPGSLRGGLLGGGALSTRGAGDSNSPAADSFVIETEGGTTIHTEDGATSIETEAG